MEFSEREFNNRTDNLRYFSGTWKLLDEKVFLSELRLLGL